MKKEHITLRIDGRLFGRVKATANRQGLTVSNFVRSVLQEKLDKDLLHPKLPLTKEEFEQRITPIIAELMIAVYGLEEMVARGFLDPTVSKNTDNEFKNSYLKSVADRAREKTTELLEFCEGR